MKKDSEKPRSSVLDVFYAGLKQEYGGRLNKMDTDLQIVIIETHWNHFVGAVKYLKQYTLLTNDNTQTK